MTVGGSGLMEAACRGARDQGGRTVACTSDSPEAQGKYPYVDRALDLHYLFVRKAMLVKYSVGFVLLPDGFGALEEICEALTLSRSGRIRDFPIVLMGEGYWRPLLDQITATLIPEPPTDPANPPVLVTDSPEEATRYILRSAGHRFGRKLIPRRASWALGEHGLRGRSSTRRRRHRFGRLSLHPLPPERKFP
jgi:uncharacterized protein (TIGR00730 family)